MKINYFAVNNFRGISGGLENNKIEFKNTNTLFIFGQNNSGKSSFLRAYEFFYSDASPSTNDFYKMNTSNSIEFEIEVQLDDYDKQRIESAAPRQKDSYKEYLNSDCLRIRRAWQQSGTKGAWKNTTYKFDVSNYVEIGYASIGLHSVFQSCLPKPIFIRAMPSEDEAKTVLNDILKVMAENTLKAAELEELDFAKRKVKELQDKMYSRETISNYESSVNEQFKKVFKDTKISINEKKDRVLWTENKLGKDFDIEFNKIGIDGSVDVNIPALVSNVGHGTIRTAIFTLLLMRDIAEKFERKDGRKDYLVLFEEPELFLYPQMIRELKDLIYKVSDDSLPYQLLSASHSPAMIDLSKPKSSILRLIKDGETTRIYQINDKFIKNAKGISTDEELKNEMYEILRFNPYICESFYARKVLLVEGPTEEIISRAYLQEISRDRDVFVLNCGTVNNIPFYQKIFSQFMIPYVVFCDTDKESTQSNDKYGNPIFSGHIQETIYLQVNQDCGKGLNSKMRVHSPTFEPAHKNIGIPEGLRIDDASGMGKPFDANQYWKNKLKPAIMSGDTNCDKIPIVKHLKEVSPIAT